MDKLRIRLEERKKFFLNEIGEMKKEISIYYLYGKCSSDCPIELLEAQLHCLQGYVHIIDLRLLYLEGTNND